MGHTGQLNEVTCVIKPKALYNMIITHSNKELL